MRHLSAMLALALVLLSASVVGAADPPGACTNAGCVRTADLDGDGRIDWASVGSGGELYGVNVIWRGAESELWYDVIVNGDDHDEHYLFAWSGGHAHAEEEHRHVDLALLVGEAHAPTGSAEEHVWLYLGVSPPHDVHPPHLP